MNNTNLLTFLAISIQDMSQGDLNVDLSEIQDTVFLEQELSCLVNPDPGIGSRRGVNSMLLFKVRINLV